MLMRKTRTFNLSIRKERVILHLKLQLCWTWTSKKLSLKIRIFLYWTFFLRLAHFLEFFKQQLELSSSSLLFDILMVSTNLKRSNTQLLLTNSTRLPPTVPPPTIPPPTRQPTNTSRPSSPQKLLLLSPPMALTSALQYLSSALPS